MKILDLFCGAGGSSMGYHLAFPEAEIVGIDIHPQPRYPFQFFQADAIEFCKKYGAQFDLIHASPPCQFASDITPDKSKHINLIPDVMDAMSISEEIRCEAQLTVIENVPRASRYLMNPIILCGKKFGLKTYRHRAFSVTPDIPEPLHIDHDDSTPPANRSGGLEANLSPKGFISCVGGGSRTHQVGRRDIFEYRKQAMGIDWMNRYELAQAIPPAYTKYIGEQLKLVTQLE
jgi:DNA (cytosine-5)-methyltransferase 1